MKNWFKKWFSKKAEKEKQTLLADLQEKLDKLEFEHVQVFDDSAQAHHSLILKNNTEVEQKIELFGWFRNKWLPNFGFPQGVEVIPTLLEASPVGHAQNYATMMEEFTTYPGFIGKFRFMSSTTRNLQKTLVLIARSADGRVYTKPKPMSVFLSPYQFQSTIIEHDCQELLNGLKAMQIILEPNSHMEVSFSFESQAKDLVVAKRNYDAKKEKLEERIAAIKEDNENPKALKGTSLDDMQRYQIVPNQSAPVDDLKDAVPPVKEPATGIKKFFNSLRTKFINLFKKGE